MAKLLKRSRARYISELIPEFTSNFGTDVQAKGVELYDLVGHHNISFIWSGITLLWFMHDKVGLSDAQVLVGLRRLIGSAKIPWDGQ